MIGETKYYVHLDDGNFRALRDDNFYGPRPSDRGWWLRGNAVISPPFLGSDGIWYEYTPWDEL